MGLKIGVLASGSAGNSTCVFTESTAILLDAGVSVRETERRLIAIDLGLDSLSAVCVSHEHDDHNGSLGALYRRTGVQLFANAGTIQAMERSDKLKGLAWNVFTNGEPFGIGDLMVEPFSVPHDSYDPVGFVVTDGTARVGVVTDMGMPTALVRERLGSCQVIVVESNHDERLLQDSKRPWSLKQRIAGRQGHLSNAQCAELLEAIAGPQLKAVFLAHLSADCNRPELAATCGARALEKAGLPGVAVKLTYPDRVSDVVEV